MSFKVQEKQCVTCIYHKKSPLNINKLERQLGKDCVGNFLGHRICHHSKDACCRGFWDRHKNNFNLGRIVQRLGGPEFVNEDILIK